MRRLLVAGTEQIVVDLQEVPAIDAEGIGVLVDLRRATSACGANLTVVHARPRVLRLIRLAGLTELVRSRGDRLVTHL